MPDFRTIGNAILDSNIVTQGLAFVAGHETPGVKSFRERKANQAEMSKLALESARAEAERRPINNRIQDENAAWAREQREQQQKLFPEQLAQQQIQTKTSKQRFAETMAQAPADRIARLDPTANDVVVNQIMQNAGEDSQVTPQDAAVMAQDPRFVKAKNLYIVGDLANKAEGGDEIAKSALDEQLTRMNMKLIETPNGKVVHDNATGKDIPYDRASFMEQWHSTLLPVITETAGRKRMADNLNSAGGRIANQFVNRLVAQGYYDEKDTGHAATATWMVMTDGVKIDKNTPPEEKQRIGRELQAFDTLQTINEGLKSTDPDEKRAIFQALTKKTIPGVDGKYPLGGKLTVVQTADAADPGVADWRSVILSYTPEGAPPGTPPTILQAPQMFEMLLAKNPVANRLKNFELSLAANKALKEQDEIDKEAKIYQRKFDFEDLRAARTKTRSESDMRAEAKAMAEAQVPADVADRDAEVSRLAGQIFIDMKSGKTVTPPQMSVDDAIKARLGF